MKGNNKKCTSLVNYEELVPFVLLLSESEEVNELIVDEFELKGKKYSINKNNNTVTIKCSDGRNLFIGLGNFKNEFPRYYLLTSYKIDDNNEMVFRTNKINSLEKKEISDKLIEDGELYFTLGNDNKKVYFNDTESLNEFEVLGNSVILKNNMLSINSDIEITKGDIFSKAIDEALIIRSKIIDGNISEHTYTGDELKIIYKLLQEEINKELETINYQKLANIKGMIKKLTPKEQQTLKKMLY